MNRLCILFFLLSALTARAGRDTLTGDTAARKIKHSAVFLSIGGPQKTSLDYAYRALIPRLPWLAADIRMGIGGSKLGSGFHFGSSAVFFRRRFKLEAGGGLGFAQQGEWSWLLAGIHYEGKKGMLVSFCLAHSFPTVSQVTFPDAQLGLGWRF